MRTQVAPRAEPASVAPPRVYNPVMQAHLRSLWLSCLVFAVPACGGDDSSTAIDAPGGGDGGGDVDAANTIDAPGGTIDAPGASVRISGVAKTVNGISQENLPGATIVAFGPGAVQLATTTSAADGTYSLALPTTGTPLDGYLRGTSPGKLDTYLYPPRPLTADRTGATMLIISQSTLNLLGTLSGTSQDPAKGFVGLVVQNAAGTAVQGATVTITPAGTARVLYAANGVPSSTATSTDASGTVFIANTNVGDVTVDAAMGATAFHEHTFNARAGVITTTVIEP